ncbi:MAG TPA: hypothetical protein VL381_04765 [Rhodocyclaceae bacterium]|nr:hypothetical protein [Rhodocyclaceae bacterium]
MKNIRLILAYTMLGSVLSLASIGSAWADGHHHSHSSVRIGIGFGVGAGPYWGPRPYYPYYYNPYPYYSAPVYPVVVSQPVVTQPQVYVEQPQVAPVNVQSAAPTQGNNYWYYCNASQTYYPYVQDCPGGWQQVVPQPPTQR